jgi:large subunit ribosomal protein L5
MSLKQQYEKEIKSKIQKDLNLTNPMSIPSLKKITLNIGLGEAINNPKAIDKVKEDFGLITGQAPVITKSKKDISNFKVRKGMPIGMMVTLRGQKMWDFAEKLVCVTLPRIRDFRGLDTTSFDGHGNYSLGIKEYNTFAEIDPNTLDKMRGLQVTIQTTAKNNDEGKKLLEYLGFPFKK